MNQFLFWLAAVDLLICVLIGYRLMWTARSLRQLPDIEPLMGNLPPVSVVVAARNEQRHIEAALQSLLNLDYENLEIIVVNDRSTDETGAVVERMAAQHIRDRAADSQTSTVPKGSRPRLRALHVQELPRGWLGKNHALYQGAGEAKGDFILFTDADIVMDPSVLRRAMKYILDEQLDHLAMLFRIRMPNWFLESFVITFSVYFLAHFKPWKVRDPKSKAYIGVGGFNLLRAQAYREMGTHQAIAMRPDDDLKLGKLVKLHGYRQDVLLAPDMIYVPWYSSLRELIVGLEKNAFAGVDYNILVVVMSSLLILLMHVFPFVAVLITSGGTQILFALVCCALLLICVHAAHSARVRLSASLAFPVAVLLFAYIQWRTMVLNLWQGGIRWRDTFYPLAELKANKV